MIKEISINKNNAILNFSKKYCSTPEELLSSSGFKNVLEKYIKHLQKGDSSLLDRMNTYIDQDSLSQTVTNLFKALMIFPLSEIKKMNPSNKSLLHNRSDLLEFIEDLYNYWRSLERYALIESSTVSSGIQNKTFIHSTLDFSNTVLQIYRTIEEKLIESNHNIYRQTTAGVNAGVVLHQSFTQLPKEYSTLNEIKFIKQIVLNPPFIIYPKENKRSGFFTETEINPIDKLLIQPSHYFCYPAKVGDSLAFIYFHRNYMSMGISLCNLFELAKPSEYENKKPDLIYVFGGRTNSTEKETVFYLDKKNNIKFGFANNTEHIDYFGYMKKMILTLHNIKMIEENKLPIHGAMVHITFKNGLTKNVAIIGDSGAGKSESLEAFRTLSKKYLKDIKVIFDDMGTFEIVNNQVVGYGTEVGAFVRLDDLEAGYSFNQMDRAIFMNPHLVNARLLMPIETYETIVKRYPIDLLLYANNYEDVKEVFTLFDTVEEAIKVFTLGKRKAKGTTTEDGLVESYFANPFGPHQMKNENDIIIDKVFSKLYQNSIPVGQIYTKLAIDGYEQKGPKLAAKRLFEWLNQKS